MKSSRLASSAVSVAILVFPGFLAFLISGCSATVPIQDLEDQGSLEVRLDANARAHEPGRQIKFFVDVTNKTSGSVDLAGLNVEIQVQEGPGKIQLRQDWTYRWNQEMILLPGRKLTLPIVPEKGVELPLEQLPEGEYNLVAVINGRHASAPYKLKIFRPDLGAPVRRS